MKQIFLIASIFVVFSSVTPALAETLTIEPEITFGETFHYDNYINGRKSPLEAVATVETAAVILAEVSSVDFKWVGVQYHGGVLIGVSCLGVALLAPTNFNDAGDGVLRIGLIALGAYNFHLNSVNATKDERRRANFWGVNLVGVATWLAHASASPSSVNYRRKWSIGPLLEPEQVGVVAEFRF